MAGAYYNAFFNVYRRTYHQILYWLPPLVLGYVLMEWATEKYDSGRRRTRTFHTLLTVEIETNTSTRSLDDWRRKQQRAVAKN